MGARATKHQIYLLPKDFNLAAGRQAVIFGLTKVSNQKYRHRAAGNGRQQAKAPRLDQTRYRFGASGDKGALFCRNQRLVVGQKLCPQGHQL
jgi:hypothetical protein